MEITKGARVTTPEGYTGTVANEPVLTSTGYVVTVKFDQSFDHVSPVGGADYAVTKLTPAAPAPEAQTEGRVLRATLGRASAMGWELLYDKPRQGCEVGRRVEDGKAQYALICKTHRQTHRLERLSDERAVRKAGGWCTSCA